MAIDLGKTVVRSLPDGWRESYVPKDRVGVGLYQQEYVGSRLKLLA